MEGVLLHLQSLWKSLAILQIFLLTYNVVVFIKRFKKNIAKRPFQSTETKGLGTDTLSENCRPFHSPEHQALATQASIKKP